MLPFASLRVLDLSRIIAGPWATQMLADCGAEVIKIERPGQGDPARHYGPPFLQDSAGRNLDESPFSISVNRNKRSAAIDIARPEGQDLIRRLAAKCDVLVENYKVGDLARYGLDYAAIRSVNPRIVYCSITGFGQSGPYAHRPGYDPIFQAMGGLMSVTGHPDGSPGEGPMKVGAVIVDVIGGMYAGFALATALYHRDCRSGQGQHIDLSLLDAEIAALSHSALHYLISGSPPGRHGNGIGGGGGSGMYRCADKLIVISPGTDAEYVALYGIIGRPELTGDERFSTYALRSHNGQALRTAIQEAFAGRESAHLLEQLEQAGIPCGPVNDMGQVFDDPQVRHRHMAASACAADGTSVPLVANPIKFSETPIGSYRAPPALGEHTREILGTLLGMDSAAMEELERSAVIGVPRAMGNLVKKRSES